MENSLPQINQIITLNNWLKVNKQLVAKILTEFMYEDLLTTTTQLLSDGVFQHSLELDDNIEYRFTAEKKNLWQLADR